MEDFEKAAVFHAVILDMLQLIRTVSKILQNNALISLKFITLCQTVTSNVPKAHKLLSSKGVDSFLEKNVFPETNKLLSQINKHNNVAITERQTCMTTHFCRRQKCFIGRLSNAGECRKCLRNMPS